MTEKYIQKIEKDIDNDFKFLKSDIIDLIDLKELETTNANYDCFKDEVYKQIYILILYNFFHSYCYYNILSRNLSTHAF